MLTTKSVKEQSLTKSILFKINYPQNNLSHTKGEQ